MSTPFPRPSLSGAATPPPDGLIPALADARSLLAAVRAPDAPLQALLARASTQSVATVPIGRATQGRWTFAWMGVGALACALTAFWLWNPMAARLPAADEGDWLAADELDAFVALADPDADWPQVATPTWVVRAELTAPQLMALGLPFDPARAGQAIRADLLLRADGEMVAVRLAR